MPFIQKLLANQFIRSRYQMGLALVVTVGAFMVLFRCYGYEKTWSLWKIPVMNPPFADLRGVIASAESAAQGFDPMRNNPNDPWGRLINYPRVTYQLISVFGLNQKDTLWIGIILIFLFLTGVYIVSPGLNWLQILLYMVALLSPAILLGVERANIDLFMFFIIAVSVVALEKMPFLYWVFS